MIAILDYGAGNLRSVARALEAVGADVAVTQDPARIALADGLVVPGQGSAVDAMRRLEKLRLADPLLAYARSGRPVLGVCLGEQIIFDASDEGDGVRCLGLLRGTCRRLAVGGNRKVPHMGWNSVHVRRGHPLLVGVPDGSYFYFVHSYYVDPIVPEVVVGETEYGVTFASIVAQGNIFATQFHPEKSGEVGLRIYANFVRECKRAAPSGTVSTAHGVV